MDKELEDRYNAVLFSEELSRMFANILEQDEASRKILKFIMRKRGNNETVSIIDIIDNVEVHRRVKVPSKNKNGMYEHQVALIDRKAAERAVEKLSAMSLIYYEKMTPYKLLYPTRRSIQVIQMIDNQKNLTEKEQN